jgi:hypothetical protein
MPSVLQVALYRANCGLRVYVSPFCMCRCSTVKHVCRFGLQTVHTRDGKGSKVRVGGLPSGLISPWGQGFAQAGLLWQLCVRWVAALLLHVSVCSTEELWAVALWLQCEIPGFQQMLRASGSFTSAPWHFWCGRHGSVLAALSTQPTFSKQQATQRASRKHQLLPYCT